MILTLWNASKKEKNKTEGKQRKGGHKGRKRRGYV
jgi:hypothetical protein